MYLIQFTWRFCVDEIYFFNIKYIFIVINSVFCCVTKSPLHHSCRISVSLSFNLNIPLLCYLLRYHVNDVYTLCDGLHVIFFYQMMWSSWLKMYVKVYKVLSEHRILFRCIARSGNSSRQRGINENKKKNLWQWSIQCGTQRGSWESQPNIVPTRKGK